jgi:hypothetical protein
MLVSIGGAAGLGMAARCRRRDCRQADRRIGDGTLAGAGALSRREGARFLKRVATLSRRLTTPICCAGVSHPCWMTPLCSKPSTGHRHQPTCWLNLQGCSTDTRMFSDCVCSSSPFAQITSSSSSTRSKGCRGSIPPDHRIRGNGHSHRGSSDMPGAMIGTLVAQVWRINLTRTSARIVTVNTSFRTSCPFAALTVRRLLMNTSPVTNAQSKHGCPMDGCIDKRIETRQPKAFRPIVPPRNRRILYGHAGIAYCQSCAAVGARSTSRQARSRRLLAL